MSQKKPVADERTCPKCSSQNSARIKGRPGLSSHRALRQCQDCGVVWRAAESKGVGWACLLIGLFVVWVEVEWIIPAKLTDFNIVAFAGIVVLLWGVLVLAGVAGKKEVIAIRRNESLLQPPRHEGREKKCPYCGQRYPPGATVCVIDENVLVDV
jgi:hypothetical protein